VSGLDYAQDWIAPENDDFRAGYLAGIDACVNIVQQSLDTVRAEDDGESRFIRHSIDAREHIVRLLTGYRDAQRNK